MNTMPMTDFSSIPSIVSFEQAADVLGVHKDTLRSFVFSGFISAMFDNDGIKFKRGDVFALYITSKQQRNGAFEKLLEFEDQNSYFFDI